jgi:hypothetical protein
MLVELMTPDVDEKIAKRTQSHRQETWWFSEIEGQKEPSQFVGRLDLQYTPAPPKPRRPSLWASPARIPRVARTTRKNT